MRNRKWALLVVALIPLALLAGCSRSDEDEDAGNYARPDSYARPADPTNTAINERDLNDAFKTPEDQGENDTDLVITQQVRQSLVDDDSLSMLAHNVKVITMEGVVTLRGPVHSAAEKLAIGTKAGEIPGVARVDNQLEVVVSDPSRTPAAIDDND